MSKKLTPYQRIVRAAKADRGVRLSPEEAWQMGALDDAIMTRARLDDEEDAEESVVDAILGGKE